MGAPSADGRRLRGRRHEEAGADGSRRRGGESPPEELRLTGARFEELHRGGLGSGGAPSQTRRRDGPSRPRVVYPTVGPWCSAITADFDYKHACFEAYKPLDRVVLRRASRPPHRHRADRDAHPPEEGIADLRAIAKLGPARRDDARASRPSRDYDSPIYDDFLGAPPSRSVCRSRGTSSRAARDGVQAARPPKMNGFLSIIRGCQGHHRHLDPGRRVSSGHPDLRRRLRRGRRRLGSTLHVPQWITPYDRHRNWLPPGQKLSKPPSQYFRDNVYHDVPGRLGRVQDGRSLMNWKTPHVGEWTSPTSDSTWALFAGAPGEAPRRTCAKSRRERILCRNVAEALQDRRRCSELSRRSISP